MKLRRTALALALAFSGAAHATGWNNVVVFGDSLSDAGTFTAIAGPGGKFTTNPGPVWSENLALGLGAAPAPAQFFNGTGYNANPGGNIWAQGGARVSGSPGVGITFAQPIAAQVATYLAQTGGRADGNTLYAVWAGANDIFFWTTPATSGGADSATIQANVLAAAQGELQQIAALNAAGARQIVVLNLPDMGRTPAALAAGPTAAAGLTALSQLYNQALNSGIASSGAGVLQLDVFRLFNEIIASPATFGFSVGNTATACLPAGSSSLSCSAASRAAPDAAQTFMFADGVHPTTGAHRIVSDYALSTLRAPALAAAVADQTTRTLDRQLRGSTVRQQRFLDGGRRPDSIDVYVDGQVIDTDGAALDGTPYGLTVGADRDFGDGWFGGLSISALRERLDAAGTGHARGTALALAAYGSKRVAAAYLSASLSHATVDYDLTRDIALGIASRNETGELTGSLTGLRLEAGYDLASGATRHGPFVGVGVLRTSLNGYREKSANATALRFGKQSYNQTLGSLGYQLSWQASDRLRLSGRASWEHAFGDSHRDLAVGVAGTSGDLPVRVGRDGGGHGELNLAASWQTGRDGTLGASLTVAGRQDGVRQNALLFGYSQRF